MSAETDALIHNKNFQGLLRLMSRQALTWDKFLDMPLPSNMSANETWALLQTYNKTFLVELPFATRYQNFSGYHMTLELNKIIYDLILASNEDSMVWEVLTNPVKQHFITEMRVENVIASARMDGLLISEQETRELLRYGATPSSSTEQLVMNIFKVDADIENLVEEPFSASLLKRLHNDLLCGVEKEELVYTEPSFGVVPTLPKPSTPQADESFLSDLMDYANDALGDEYDLPVLRGFLIADIMRYFSPVPVVSSQIGRLFSQLYFRKHGFSVLSALPLFRAKVRWELGTLDSSRITITRQQYDDTLSHSYTTEFYDPTIYFTIVTQLALAEIDTLQAGIHEWTNRDQEIRLILEDEPHLNHRQRSIIARALRNPAAEFSIQYHKNNHNIAYATARSDLQELHQKGYLTMKQVGKAFIFQPAQRLKNLLTTE